MSYTTSQREALKQAIASGVLSLSYDGKTVSIFFVPISVRA